ncbi:hypothetical protein F4810DRAFT_721697 [Camillea tinctor]|nr:hypothetical protein F4810DRAFT_721697 [Camillea tinctor]
MNINIEDFAARTATLFGNHHAHHFTSSPRTTIQKPHTMSSNIFKNEYYGHDSGGHEFTALGNSDQMPIKTLKVWTINGEGDHEIIKAIKIIWQNNEQQTFGNPTEQAKYGYTFEEDETIQHMSVFAGDWVDSLWFQTKKTPGTKLGGSGGVEHKQNVQNGVFVGLWGRCGSDIDALGSIFLKNSGKAQTRDACKSATNQESYRTRASDYTHDNIIFKASHGTDNTAQSIQDHQAQMSQVIDNISAPLKGPHTTGNKK